LTTRPAAPPPGTISAIVTDIEGTTSSIAFVADELFPYAARHLKAWVAAHPAEAAPILEHVAAAEPGDPRETLLRWIAEDRKATPLKTLQGMIWADGFASGELRGHVYPDAAAALRRWHGQGLRLAVYSSGSIAAQKLIFGHSTAGDLSGLFSSWFDTTTGPKREAGSYAKIADALGLPPDAILFLTDVEAEADAARAAGLHAAMIDRTGGGAGLASFDELGL